MRWEEWMEQSEWVSLFSRQYTTTSTACASVWTTERINREQWINFPFLNNYQPEKWFPLNKLQDRFEKVFHIHFRFARPGEHFCLDYEYSRRGVSRCLPELSRSAKAIWHFSPFEKRPMRRCWCCCYVIWYEKAFNQFHGYVCCHCCSLPAFLSLSPFSIGRKAVATAIWAASHFIVPHSNTLSIR